MNTASTTEKLAYSGQDSICEILVLPDGRIFAHNISPLLAEVLTELDPADAAMKQRAIRVKKV